jgi:hypothetical protein
MSEAGVTKSSVLSTLLENHRLFLAFLERRVGTKADAEDILQAAFVKMMESPTRLPMKSEWLHGSIGSFETPSVTITVAETPSRERTRWPLAGRRL